MVGQLWRVAGAFRVVALFYAAVLVVRDDAHYTHPAVAYGTLVAMAVWTAVTVVAYSRERGRRPWLVGIDVAVAAAMVMATRLADSSALIHEGAMTLPAAWTAAAVIACGLRGGPWAGLGGAAVLSAADVVERAGMSKATFNGAVLLLMVGAISGWVMRLVVRAEAATDRAARVEAATAERDRIARDVHDSVLQVLAYVSMRGRELGGEADALGRLAGEQEAVLRNLITTPGTTAPPLRPAANPPATPAATPTADLRKLLQPLACADVTVSCPAEAVPLLESTARALAEATGEALSNVRRHAGSEAHAWVLLEDEEAEVRVTIRDDGVGFPPERLAEAARAGRLGVAQSIVGRMRDAGGGADVASTPGNGTEVELHVGRE